MDDCTDAEFCEMFEELDAEHRVTVVLLINALLRGDEEMVEALGAYGRSTRTDHPEAKCEVDYDLLGRIKSVCSEDESLNWGRALVWCVERGDVNKATTLQNLMRRRVAA